MIADLVFSCASSACCHAGLLSSILLDGWTMDDKSFDFSDFSVILDIFDVIDAFTLDSRSDNFLKLLTDLSCFKFSRSSSETLNATDFLDFAIEDLPLLSSYFYSSRALLAALLNDSRTLSSEFLRRSVFLFLTVDCCGLSSRPRTMIEPRWTGSSFCFILVGVFPEIRFLFRFPYPLAITFFLVTKISSNPPFKNS